MGKTYEQLIRDSAILDWLKEQIEYEVVGEKFYIALDLFGVGTYSNTPPTLDEAFTLLTLKQEGEPH